MHAIYSECMLECNIRRSGYDSHQSRSSLGCRLNSTVKWDSLHRHQMGKKGSL